MEGQVEEGKEEKGDVEDGKEERGEVEEGQGRQKRKKREELG